MNKVLLSIRPKWCALIANGIKKIEVRKSSPKEVPFKCLIYCTKEKIFGEILLTKHGNVCGKNRGFRDDGDIPLAGKVIGEFICDKVIKYESVVIGCAKYEVNGGYVEEKNRYNAGACLTAEEMFDYSNGKPLYGWHISDLKIYDKPKDLSEFLSCPYKKMKLNCELCEYYGYSGCGHRITRPPQSWQYVEEVK